MKRNSKTDNMRARGRAWAEALRQARPNSWRVAVSASCGDRMNPFQRGAMGVVEEEKPYQ